MTEAQATQLIGVLNDIASTLFAIMVALGCIVGALMTGGRK